jgi:hypothetical protein
VSIAKYLLFFVTTLKKVWIGITKEGEGRK